MAHPSSYAIPFVVLAIVLISTYYHIDLSAYVPLLTAAGVGGIPLSILTKAIDASKSSPITKEQIDQIITLAKK